MSKTDLILLEASSHAAVRQMIGQGLDPQSDIKQCKDGTLHVDGTQIVMRQSSVDQLLAARARRARRAAKHEFYTRTPLERHVDKHGCHDRAQPCEARTRLEEIAQRR